MAATGHVHDIRNIVIVSVAVVEEAHPDVGVKRRSESRAEASESRMRSAGPVSAEPVCSRRAASTSATACSGSPRIGPQSGRGLSLRGNGNSWRGD